MIATCRLANVNGLEHTVRTVTPTAVPTSSSRSGAIGNAVPVIVTRLVVSITPTWKLLASMLGWIDSSHIGRHTGLSTNGRTPTGDATNGCDGTMASGTPSIWGWLKRKAVAVRSARGNASSMAMGLVAALKSPLPSTTITQLGVCVDSYASGATGYSGLSTIAVFWRRLSETIWTNSSGHPRG